MISRMSSVGMVDKFGGSERAPSDASTTAPSVAFYF